MDDSSGSDEELVLAAVPVMEVDLTWQAEAVSHLEAYLSKATGLTVRVVIPQSYEEVLAGLERGEIDAARLGPYAFALAQARFGARALVNAVSLIEKDETRPAPYRSVIFTRTDSGITNLSQLKGQTFGFVDRNSTTGYLVATFMLQQAGLDIAHDLAPRFLLSHKAVAEAVGRGELIAGAIQEEEFTRQSQATGAAPLRILAVSPLIPKGPVAVRPALPRPLERKLQAALVQIHRQEPIVYYLISTPNQRFAPATGREITLKTIAELAGVSYATVSRAINGRDRISPATTARILTLVEELGYRPNANARSLQKSSGELVGLFLPTLDFPGLNELVSGIQEVLSEAGLKLVICPIGKPDDNPENLRSQQYFELLYSGRLAGVILTQWSLVGSQALELTNSGFPAVLLEQDLLEEGFKVLWQWLAEQSQPGLALIASPQSLLEPESTRRVLTQLVGTAIPYFNSAEDNFSEQLELLLEKSTKPPILVCTDDQTALFILEAYQKRYPDLVVTGFGNSSLASWAGFPTVAFEAKAVGWKAGQRLLKLLDITPETKSEIYKQSASGVEARLVARRGKLL